jgi:Carbohydrate esterase, sialic acid-specific acetylesterase
MTTFAFGSDVRRRSATFGGLALLGVSVFIFGARAGVVRIWPVRYSLFLLEGPPKPFVNEPESLPIAVDSAGRLMRYAGKSEVPCPKQTPRTGVLLIAGQSNAANSAAQRHETRHPDRVLNFISGRCYVAASPLLSSTGFAGEPWTLMADELIEQGAFDHVILAPVAVGGSNIAQWAKGGALNASMIPLLQDLTTHYRVTYVLWHQGESDFALKTDPARYKEQFLSFVETLRVNAVDATVFVSTATRCLPGWSEPNAIQSAQRELASAHPQFEPGVDTDKLFEAQDRYDDCHFADSGEVKTARAWAAILTRHPWPKHARSPTRGALSGRGSWRILPYGDRPETAATGPKADSARGFVESALSNRLLLPFHKSAQFHPVGRAIFPPLRNKTGHGYLHLSLLAPSPLRLQTAGCA